MRRLRWISFIVLLLALASCQDPTTPIDGLHVTPWASNPCGFFLAPPAGSVQRIQLVDCTSF